MESSVGSTYGDPTTYLNSVSRISFQTSSQIVYIGDLVDKVPGITNQAFFFSLLSLKW